MASGVSGLGFLVIGLEGCRLLLSGLEGESRLPKERSSRYAPTVQSSC